MLNTQQQEPLSNYIHTGPVPLGIVHSEGTVVELLTGGSSRYLRLCIGAQLIYLS